MKQCLIMGMYEPIPDDDFFSTLLRSFSFKIFFLSLMDLGITSTPSSSLIKSMADSRVNSRGGVKMIFSSLPAAMTRNGRMCIIVEHIYVNEEKWLIEPV